MKTLPTLNNIQDVQVTTPTSGQALTFNGTSWVNGDVASPATTLDGLTDVTITTPTSGQALTFNGTSWVNGATVGESNKITQGNSELSINDLGVDPSSLDLNIDGVHVMKADSNKIVFQRTSVSWISYVF
jgi:hypothetical protein